MRELLSYNSLFVGQLHEDKLKALRSCELIFFATDLQTVNITEQFTARADIFLKYSTTRLKKSPFDSPIYIPFSQVFCYFTLRANTREILAVSAYASSEGSEHKHTHARTHARGGHVKNGPNPSVSLQLN